MESIILRMNRAFMQSLKIAKRLKNLIFLVTVVYILTLFAGGLLVTMQIPEVMELGDLIFEGISSNPIYLPIIGALESGNLITAITYTFLINLSSGAFISTTLPGIVPILGAIGSLLVTIFRGFMIGALFTYAGIFNISTGYTAVVLGTLILELGAYVFSATAGINISFSVILPHRYQTENRWYAFKQAWRDAAYLYIIVGILLTLGAIWEMSGIYFTLP